MAIKISCLSYLSFFQSLFVPIALSVCLFVPLVLVPQGLNTYHLFLIKVFKLDMHLFFDNHPSKFPPFDYTCNPS